MKSSRLGWGRLKELQVRVMSLESSRVAVVVFSVDLELRGKV